MLQKGLALPAQLAALSRPIREECPPASRIKLTSRIRPAFRSSRISRAAASHPPTRRGRPWVSSSGRPRALAPARCRPVQRCCPGAPAGSSDLVSARTLPAGSHPLAGTDWSHPDPADQRRTAQNLVPTNTTVPTAPAAKQRLLSVPGTSASVVTVVALDHRHCSRSAVSAGITFSQYVVLPEVSSPRRSNNPGVFITASPHLRSAPVQGRAACGQVQQQFSSLHTGKHPQHEAPG